MSHRSDKVLLVDLLEAIRTIESFVRDYDEKLYKEDIKTQAAVERYLEILGEAANKLSESFILKYNHVQWHRIISLKNRIIHAYFDVSVSIVWNIIEQYLPLLKADIEKIFNEFENE